MSQRAHKPSPDRHADEDAEAFRLGSAALGLLAGAVVGLVCAGLRIYLFDAGASLPILVLGMGAIGALVGVVFPESAWTLAEAVLHFLAGLSTSVSDRCMPASSTSPLWLKVALWAGVAVGLLIVML